MPDPRLDPQQTQTYRDPDGTISDKGGPILHLRAGDPAPPPPEVPGYEVEGVLGRGGMGVVYKARHLALKRTVALKMILVGGHAGPQEITRFRAEAEAVARLQHPNIVQVFEVGEQNGLPYCTLEFVQGGNLAGKLAGKPLPPPEAARLVETLAGAMHLAHSRNVVHRDLKPANVLLTLPDETSGSLGIPKVTDFGLARQLDVDHRHTQAGMVMGTPSYMAPEQASGLSHAAGPAVDVYALGAILYECLTGRPPFRGASTLEILDQVRHAEPVSPRAVQPQLPRDLEVICLKCLRKEPEKRYASARELADDLSRWRLGEPIHARPVGSTERAVKWVRRNPVVALLTGLLAVSLVAGIAIATYLAILAGQREQQAVNAAELAGQREGEAKTSANIARAEKVKAEASEKRAQRGEAKAKQEALAARRNLYGAQTWIIERRWDSDQIGPFLDLLRKQRPAPGDPTDFRGFEWYYWQRLGLTARLTLPTHVVNALAFSPDGHRLVSGGSDNRLKVWDTASGRELLTFKGAVGRLDAVAFSPDGKQIVSSGGLPPRPGELYLWDATTGRMTLVLQGHATIVTCVAYSPNGKYLVSGSRDHTVKVWDPRTGREVRTLQGHTLPVTAVAFSPDSRQFASAAQDRSVRLWNAEDGKEVHVLSLKMTDMPAYALAFSPDGKRLASLGVDRAVLLWDASKGTRLAAVPGHTLVFGRRIAAHSFSLSFSPDGQRLVFPAGNLISVLDGHTARFLYSLKGHTGQVTCVRFSPDGRRLASGSTDRSIRFWDADTRHEPFTLKGQNSASGLAFSPDSRRLASSGHDSTVRIWDVATRKELVCCKGHVGLVNGVAFDPSGARVASAGDDRTVKVWDAATGKALLTLTGHTNDVIRVAFSRDGKYIASASEDRTARVWDAATGASVATFPHPGGRVLGVAFSPDGRLLATSSEVVRLWDLKTRKVVRLLGGHPAAVGGLCFSDDGQRLVSASGGGMGLRNMSAGLPGVIKIWDPATGKLLLSLPGVSPGILSVAFSPDGKRVAAGSIADGTVQIWDAGNGQEVLTLPGSGSPVLSVAFSPDGHWLASGTALEGTIRLWDGRPLPPEGEYEPEARDLVNFAFDKLVLKSEVLAHLRAQAGVLEPVRQLALRLAETHLDDALMLNDSSWAVVRQPGAQGAAYALALKQAEAACRLEPAHSFYRNTLGVAQYRTGQYEKAVATLTQTEKANAILFKGPVPGDAAFLAMAQHQLGQKDQARATLERLREAMKRPLWATNPEARLVASEAEKLLKDSSDPP